MLTCDRAFELRGRTDIPGATAHSCSYEWVAEQFVADRLAVYAVDLRGRGNSDGERFYVDAFEDYVRDVEAVRAILKTREPGLPIYMLGHSGGRRGFLPLRCRPPG